MSHTVFHVICGYFPETPPPLQTNTFPMKNRSFALEREITPLQSSNFYENSTRNSICGQ
eukprot:TRINITY_DN13173_c0_g1_i1.p1 TRINITY_DN13173_c0_g1~~TRINITY_DN13173_c0_g1_i1.p1  ORF type:complete len:59 (+),score=3.67 TRINITY_DN13173_c0_g1_i1:363-539(+)